MFKRVTATEFIGSFNESDKKRMRFIGSAFEFRVELNADEEIPVRDFNGFDKFAVR